MTAYAPSDVAAITIPVDKGGCGKCHTVEGDGRMTVDCPACQSIVLGQMPGHGWAGDPASVMLTPDERALVESQTTAAVQGSNVEIAQALAGIAKILHAQAAPAIPASPGSLVEGMSGTELDALAKLIATRRTQLKKPGTES